MSEKYNWQKKNSERELLEKQLNGNERLTDKLRRIIGKNKYVLGMVLPLIIAFFMFIGIYYFTMRTVSVRMEVFDSKGVPISLKNEEWIIDNLKIIKIGDNSALIKSRVKNEKSFIWEIEGYEEKDINIRFDKSKTMKVELRRFIYKPIIVRDEKGNSLDSVQISGVEYEYKNGLINLKAPEESSIIVKFIKSGYMALYKKVDFVNEDILCLYLETIGYIGENEFHYKEYRNEKDRSVLIYIPAGEFTMGSEEGGSGEKPVHKVYLDGYYISKYEVTNKQYKKFCDETGRSYPSDPGFSGMSSYFTSYPDYPVVNVSWNDAKAYCAWAGLRLPTEAEWEKAARGTDSRKYPWGNEDPGTSKCNMSGTEDGYKYTSPIGSYKGGRSPFGCYDMAGNVWEWCNDWSGNNYYRDSEYRNPKGPSSGSYKLCRGGSWYFVAYSVRSAYRAGDKPSRIDNICGFRPAK